MTIRFIVVGRTTEDYMQRGIEEYCARLKHYCRLEFVVIPELRNTKSLSESEIKQQEGALILRHIARGEVAVLLDEAGKVYSSEGFAEYVAGFGNRGVRTLSFVVGGAYGFSQEVYSRADAKMSLSQMTFSHQMVRLIFLEQLYRAHTILAGHPYHHR